MKSHTAKIRRVLKSLWARPGIAVLLLIWIFVAVALMSGSGDQRFTMPQAGPNPGSFRAASRTIEDFQTWRADHADESRPLYRLSFESLTAANGSHGAFKTALHKTVTIEALRLRLYTYSASKPAATGGVDEPALTATGGPKDRIITEVIRTLTRTDGSWNLGPDVSNTTEILVRDFEYTLFFDHRRDLDIKCMRAAVESWPRISLRGCVMVTAADGSRLQTNKAVWDARANTFLVPGSYYLTKNATSSTGRRVKFDACLNPLRRRAVATVHERNGRNG